MTVTESRSVMLLLKGGEDGVGDDDCQDDGNGEAQRAGYMVAEGGED